MIPRDYNLFDALANGRCVQLGCSDNEPSALYLPCSISSDLCCEAAVEYYDLFMEPEAINPRYQNDYQNVSSTEAEQRVTTEGAHFGQKQECWPVVPKIGRFNANWLTWDEIRSFLQHAEIPISRIAIEFQAMLQAMEMLSGPSSG